MLPLPNSGKFLPPESAPLSQSAQRDRSDSEVTLTEAGQAAIRCSATSAPPAVSPAVGARLSSMRTIAEVPSTRADR